MEEEGWEEQAFVGTGKRYSTGKGAIFKNSFHIQYCVYKGIKAQVQDCIKLYSALDSIIFKMAIPVQYSI